MARFHAYGVGDEYASACTDFTDPMAEAQMNLDHPDAIGEWHVADEPFAAGSDHETPNGTACPDGMPGCRHVLFRRP